MPWNKVCAVAAALLWVPSLAAQKTDTVVLRNGDRITGEIKNLQRNTLSYSTDDMGTLSVEWDKVVRLTSRRNFEVEVMSGRRYYGVLAPASEPEYLVVETTGFTDTLPRVYVVRLHPLGASFISRIDGHIDVGFTFQRANDILQLSVAAAAEHRTQRWRNYVELSTYFQDQADVEGSSRNSASFATQRLYASRWSGLGSASLEQNEELELDLRTSVAGGVGRFLLQNNYTMLLVAAGLTYTHENFAASDGSNNLEALFTGQFDYFRRDSPKSDVRVTLTAFPSLTNFGRVRLDFDARVSHELVKDFTIALTFFDTFDSRPPSATATKNDFGGTLSLGWTF